LRTQWGSSTPGCRLVFFGAANERGLSAALATVAGQPVLTLGDLDGFAARGGMVGLAVVDDALRFDVNLRAMRAAGMGLAAPVLKLARRVIE
jgi:hypothetical protein